MHAGQKKKQRQRLRTVLGRTDNVNYIAMPTGSSAETHQWMRTRQEFIPFAANNCIRKSRQHSQRGLMNFQATVSTGRAQGETRGGSGQSATVDDQLWLERTAKDGRAEPSRCGPNIMGGANTIFFSSAEIVACCMFFTLCRSRDFSPLFFLLNRLIAKTPRLEVNEEEATGSWKKIAPPMNHFGVYYGGDLKRGV